MCEKGQAIECSLCSESEYSLEASNFCSRRPSCTMSDFQDFYTPCSVDTTRVHYLAAMGTSRSVHIIIFRPKYMCNNIVYCNKQCVFVFK